MRREIGCKNTSFFDTNNSRKKKIDGGRGNAPSYLQSAVYLGFVENALHIVNHTLFVCKEFSGIQNFELIVRDS